MKTNENKNGKRHQSPRGNCIVPMCEKKANPRPVGFPIARSEGEPPVVCIALNVWVCDEHIKRDSLSKLPRKRYENITYGLLSWLITSNYLAGAPFGESPE